eukprot:6433041-Alexandrium_andersonii.AAC.1
MPLEPRLISSSAPLPFRLVPLSGINPHFGAPITFLSLSCFGPLRWPESLHGDESSPVGSPTMTAPRPFSAPDSVSASSVSLSTRSHSRRFRIDPFRPLSMLSSTVPCPSPSTPWANSEPIMLESQTTYAKPRHMLGRPQL